MSECHKKSYLKIYQSSVSSLHAWCLFTFMYIYMYIICCIHYTVCVHLYNQYTCMFVYISSHQLSGMKEWRRLKLNVLRHRIQRLVVLMDLSEPGTVPDHGMLASLLDLVRIHSCVFCVKSTYIY